MNTTKMILVPAESQTGGNEPEPSPENFEKPKRIDRNPQKIEKLLKIALKIASKNAYDEDFQIKDQNGTPIINSDITALLNSAISPQKLLIGEQEFIRLLYETRVNPNWIVNENMRSKLLNYTPKSPTPQNPPPPPELPPPENSSDIPPPLVIPPSESTQVIPTTEPSTSNKRKALDCGPKNKKSRDIQPWEVPLPEDDDF